MPTGAFTETHDAREKLARKKGKKATLHRTHGWMSCSAWPFWAINWYLEALGGGKVDGQSIVRPDPCWVGTKAPATPVDWSRDGHP